MLKLCKINALPNGTLGLHLSRAPWDPYPWVSGVTDGSSAYLAGVRVGDTLLEYNGIDVLGWKISELANKIHSQWAGGAKLVNFLIWRNKCENQQQSNDSGPNINQQSLQKFATCLQNIAQLLECPVCLEVVKPPGWQCCNGHVLCNGCRCRTIKCPICRVPLGPRGRCLLSDKLFTLLAETFPCDGVRNDNKNGRCPDDFNNTIKRRTSILQVTESPGISMEKFRNENDTTSRSSSSSSHSSSSSTGHDGQSISSSCTTSDGCGSNYSSCRSIRTLKITNPKDQKQIINVKNPQLFTHSNIDSTVTQTISPTQISSSSSAAASSSLVTIVNLSMTPSSTIISQRTIPGPEISSNQETQNSFLYKNYHCPTGKSCNIQDENDENCKIYKTNRITSKTNTNIGISSSTTTTTTTNYITTNNKHNKSHQNINQNIQWDVLTHLRRVHQLSVCQYYGIFGERFQVDLMNNKSILCISIESQSSLRNYFPNSSSSSTSVPIIDNSIRKFSKYQHQPQQIENLSTSTNQNINNNNNNNNNQDKMTTNEIFLTVVKNYNSIPIPFGQNSKIIHSNNADDGDSLSSMTDINDGVRNSSNTNLINIPKTMFNSNETDKSAQGTELFFIAKIPLNDDAAGAEDIGFSNRWRHNIPSPSGKAPTSTIVTTNINIDGNTNNCCSNQFQFYGNTKPDNITRQQPDTTTGKIHFDKPISDDADASILSCCSILAKGYTKRKYAIFVWYCGNDMNVENFQVSMKWSRNGIEDCNTSRITNTGQMINFWIHPMTKSWNLISSQKQYFVLDGDAVDVGGSFFEIVIDMKNEK